MKPKIKNNASVETPSKHLEHIEDLMLANGVAGAEQAGKIMADVFSAIRGNQNNNLTITEKWDGSPSVFIGTFDGKFFIATKGLLNKNPKFATSVEEIKELYSEGLAAKLIPLFEVFKQSKIDGIYQGDVLFYSPESKQKTTIDDRDVATFQPNTLIYAAPKNTPAYSQILKKKVGVVFHTKYEGEDLSSLQPTYGINPNKIPSAPDAWSIAASWEYARAIDMYSVSFLNKMQQRLWELTRVAKESGDLEAVVSDQKTIELFRRFNNIKIKNNNSIRSGGQYVKDFMMYIMDYYNAEADKVKTEKTKASKLLEAKEKIQAIKDNFQAWYNILELYTGVIDLKLALLMKLQQSALLETYVEQGNVLNSTSPEGYVVVQGDTVVKFVDRMAFSRFNFNQPKQFT